jgi:undecaprenyl-diphosphatase
MSIFDAFLLGIVEGVSEFLPISSTGHLILTAELLKLGNSEFLKTFEIVIQLGAIFAVVALYWKKFFLEREVLKRVLVALVPTLVIGALFYKIVKTYFLGNSAVVVWSLILGGIFLIIFEMFHREKETAEGDMQNISFKQSLVIGVFQSIAIIPGVSRSASTIIGGLILGLKRKTIVEFSFLLAVPTMAAASALDVYKNYQFFSADQFGILAVGFVTAFVVAILSIKWLLNFIQNNSFIGFGVYRILVAVLFWFFVLK